MNKKETLIILIIICFLCLYSYNIVTIIIGTSYVDGVYLALAKSLALNRGYREIWKPHEPMHCYFPPLYPLLLSFIWKIYPSFPQNLFYLKFFNVLLAGICLFLIYKLAKKWTGSYLIGAMVMILTATNYSFIVNSVSIDSEILYMSIQFGIFYLADKYFLKPKKTISMLLSLTILILALFLTRTIGIAMVFALVVALVKDKDIKLPKGFILIIISGFLALSAAWFFYTITTMNKSHLRFYVFLTPSLSIFFSRAIKNIIELFFYHLPFTVFHTLYSATVLSWFNYLKLNWVSAASGIVISMPILYGAIKTLKTKHAFFYYYFIFYLMLISLWVHIPVSFLLILLPFLILFLFVGINELFVTSKRIVSITMVALVFLVLLLANIKRDIHKDVIADKKSLADYFTQTHLSLYDWIKKNTNKDDIIATTYDAMLYLYTDRKTVRYIFRDDTYKNNDRYELFKKTKVSYIAQVPYRSEKGMVRGISRIKNIKNRYPESLKLVYRGKNPLFCIYKFKPNSRN